ncbi:MAG TPA: hypothetical protein VHP14_22100 [Anaerolineales bacterium]|nr:hypothetical protein [Anaerolineales bacterium]
MNKLVKQILFWTPRVAGILFVLFISLFALDIFDMQLGFWGTVVGLFMHLIPSILLTIAIVIAWKREWFGAALFIGWAIFYVASTHGFEWFVYLLIAGLPALIGLLFLAGWIWRRQIRESRL